MSLNSFHIRLTVIGLIGTILTLTGPSAHAQSAIITIDEDFSDWTPGLFTHTDGTDNGGGLDLLDFQVTNDDDYLFIKFTLNTPIDLTDNIVPNNLWLHMDTDNDPTTGSNVQAGYEGVDLSINFRDHYAWFNFSVPDEQVELYSFGLRPAPTVTSETFEIAIDRDAIPHQGFLLFQSDTIRILFEEQLDGDVMPNPGTVVSYVFDNTAVDAYQPVNIAKENPNHVRVVNWNLNINSGWAGASKLPNVEKIVRALNADVYAFQESSGTSAAETESYLDIWLPLTSGSWECAKQGGTVTCSRWPILDTWPLTRQYATLLDNPDTAQSDLLVVNAHLNCCGNDAARQEQADEYAAFVLDAKVPGGDITLEEGTPIVHLGDMNLVGFREQLHTLITGNIQDVSTYGMGGPLDWDSTDLFDAVPLHADLRMTYTWRNRNGQGYPPGRLDFQFSTDAVVDVEKSFVLDTEVMSPGRLALYGFDVNDSWWASDHLPVTVDYSFASDSTDTTTVDIPEINGEDAYNLTVYPNPADQQIAVRLEAPSRVVVELQLINVHGQVVWASGPVRLSEADVLPIPVNDLAAGLYLLRTNGPSGTHSHRVMVAH